VEVIKELLDEIWGKFDKNEQLFLWYRGQENVGWDLVPKIFRNFLERERRADSELIKSMASRERHIFHEFCLNAPGVAEKLPGEGDHLGWLSLMQHHGAPTRLLDWTSNPLVALFFMAKSSVGEDGELLVMNPRTLNKKSLNYESLTLPSHPEVLYYASQVDVSVKEKDRRINLKKPNQREIKLPMTPIAIVPYKRFGRLVNQSGFFTIHPYLDEPNRMENVLNNNLVRMKVKSTKKIQLLNELSTLRISDDTLFPDLDGLAKYVVFDANRYR
jgi:hypothetical protein